MVPPAVGLLLLGHGAIWLLWLLILLTPLVWKGTWRWRWTALLLSPIAVAVLAFSGGVLSFALGRATYEGYGLPTPEYWNLEPITRAPRWNGGCVMFGHELLTAIPNNAGIDAMGSVFGRMPSAYDGPYPSRAATKEIVESAREQLTLDELQRGTGLVGGIRIALDPRALRALDVQRRPGDRPASVAAALLGERLLVLGETGRGWRLNHVVDLRSQQVVANYGDSVD